MKRTNLKPPLRGRPSLRIELTLPWPPTVNTYYRNIKGRTIISAKGRDYRTDTIAACLEQHVNEHVKGRIGLELRCYPPDRRTRDLDNLTKALIDSLQHAGLFEDDSQIDKITIIRRDDPLCSPGTVDVDLWQLIEE